MGWYGDIITCPNCGDEKAAQCQFRNDCKSLLTIVCTNCGLHAFAPSRLWIVEKSYIDKSVIGKNPEDIQLNYELMEDKDNENILTEPLNTI